MIMLENIKHIHDFDKYQFSFKAEHLTTLFTKIFKQINDLCK